ncbi:MAG TPA: hypothetical protein VHU80_12740 [Polyangiaceae bacterium]|nr:hypothetical protein [Polyangiaceae bacterium]
MIRGSAALLLGLALPALVAACGSSRTLGPAPGSSTGIPGGTGAFAVVAAGGSEKLYLPQHPSDAAPASLAVVDVSAAGAGVRGAPALLTSIALGPGGDTGYATTTAGDSTIVLAASTESPTIWFVDPTTDAVVDRLRLEPSYGQSTFGGNGGYVTNIAMDPAHGRAILGVWNGFAVLDLATRKIDRVVSAPPSENFALDPVHGWLIAPFYDCASSVDPAGNAPAACDEPHAPDGAPMTDGLEVIDLADDTVYTYENSRAENPAAPVGTAPSSAAVDPGSGLVIVPSRNRQYQTIIDLSRADFDRATRTVTAPATVLHGNGLPDVAIAPPAHLAFWEGTDAADIGAGRVPTLAPATSAGDGPTSGDGGATANRDAGSTGDGGALPDYVFGLMPALPDGTPFMNVMSSHGIAVWPAAIGGAAFGITVSADYRWVARVDLGALLALPAAYHEVSDVSSAVTLLDARTPAARRRDSDAGQ